MRNLLFLCASLLVAQVSFADKLVILSPHRKSIQEAYIPAFQAFYKQKYKADVQVDWLDQGGTSDDVRFLKAKYGKNPKSADIDIFWGGGSAVYTDLAKEGLFQSVKLDKTLDAQLPTKVGGVDLRDKKGQWYASALSSFGIFYNKKILKMDKLPELKTWEDMANPAYFDNISLADPRRSGTSTTMIAIVLQSLGWEKGWEVLTAISGNTRKFTHSSSDPIKAVVSGDVAAAMAIDFYALAKIGDLGKDNLGYSMPEGKTVLDPDPIALLKGAPNQEVAKRFIDYVLSPEGQKLLILPKGAKGGPTMETLGRMSVNRQAYVETGAASVTPDPFKLKGFLTYDSAKTARINNLLNDLFGALMVDTHNDLKSAWQGPAKKGAIDATLLKKLGAIPLTEKQALELSDKWNDNVLRNQKINEWVAFAKAKYAAK
jgi:ABC-type Fe3+ transport system substrate-binding protein